MSVTEDSAVDALEGGTDDFFGDCFEYVFLDGFLLKNFVEGKVQVRIGSGSFEVGDLQRALIGALQAAAGAVILGLHFAQGPDPDIDANIVTSFAHYYNY